MVAMRDIRAFSEAIAREFNPDRIILFGSYARGEAARDSDVDMLVVMAYRGHPTHKAIEIRTRLDCRFALDLLVRSPAQIRRRMQMDDWFIREIMEQGKILYEADDQRVGRKGRRGLPERRTRNAGAQSAKL
ncbi:MAG: nucleotidyltransferase domain-containing protein [Planctomycetota bacterium]